MTSLIELQDYGDPRLDVFARLNETQLRHYYEPNGGLFIAESPKVAERALAAGIEPVAGLVDRREAEGEAREIVQTLDRRVIVIALVGLLVNGIPIIGFPCFLISFNTLVMSRLRAFLNPLPGCMGKLLFTFLKVLFMLIVVLVSSIIPFAGLLMYVPYGIYYLHNRKAFLKATA